MTFSVILTWKIFAFRKNSPGQDALRANFLPNKAPEFPTPSPAYHSLFPKLPLKLFETKGKRLSTRFQLFIEILNRLKKVTIILGCFGTAPWDARAASRASWCKIRARSRRWTGEASTCEICWSPSNEGMSGWLPYNKSSGAAIRPRKYETLSIEFVTRSCVMFSKKSEKYAWPPLNNDVTVSCGRLRPSKAELSVIRTSKIEPRDSRSLRESDRCANIDMVQLVRRRSFEWPGINKMFLAERLPCWSPYTWRNCSPSRMWHIHLSTCGSGTIGSK